MESWARTAWNFDSTAIRLNGGTHFSIRWPVQASSYAAQAGHVVADDVLAVDFDAAEAGARCVPVRTRRTCLL
jgi:hypothetical protein